MNWVLVTPFSSGSLSSGHGEHVWRWWVGVCESWRPAEFWHQDRRTGGEGHGVPDAGEMENHSDMLFIQQKQTLSQTLRCFEWLRCLRNKKTWLKFLASHCYFYSGYTIQVVSKQLHSNKENNTSFCKGL